MGESVSAREEAPIAVDLNGALQLAVQLAGLRQLLQDAASTQ
jgi:hypothetical protein